MTPEQYKALSDKEKLMYDEMAGFARRVSERMEEMIDLLKTIVALDAE